MVGSATATVEKRDTKVTFCRLDLGKAGMLLLKQTDFLYDVVSIENATHGNDT